MPRKRTNKARIVKRLPQSKGKTNIRIDRKRTAKAPGRRISASGRRYTETRPNRSDRSKKKRL